MPSRWDDVITRLSRLDLERALARLCEGDVERLRSAVTGQPVRTLPSDAARAGVLRNVVAELHARGEEPVPEIVERLRRYGK